MSMNVFMEIFLFFVTILQFLFPFAFKDTEQVPEQPDDSFVEEVVPGDHVHTGGNCLIGAICEICGEEYADKGEHVYITTAKQATCTEDGYVTYRCNLCYHTETGNVIPAKGHQNVRKEVAATCTNAGYITETCSVCGAFEKTPTDAAKGHTYVETNVPATCEKEGYVEFKCEDCGSSYTRITDPAIGHSYSAGTVLPADCYKGDRTEFVCENCGDVDYVETSAPLGHNYVASVTDPTCVADGYTTHTCTRCGSYYTDTVVARIGHSYTSYVYQNDATCRKDGTQIATCDNGCGTSSIIDLVGSRLPHTDADMDMYCDYGGEYLVMEYDSLSYPSEVLNNNSVSYKTLMARADETDENVYVANQGYENYGLFTSPYYAAAVNGTSIPVYSTVVFLGESRKGAIHSFSEIYVKEGEFATFDLELTDITSDFSISNASVLPASSGVVSSTTSNTVNVRLSGFGVHTILINNGDQRYAYTIHVREDYDEDAEIAELRAQGYTVSVIDGYLELDYAIFSGSAVSNQVVYLKKGAYVSFKHSIDINSDDDNKNKSEATAEGAQAINHNGLGLNRFPAISAHANNNTKILGYGVFDLTRLDRAERRGLVFTFANNVEVRGVKVINAPEWSVITYRCDNVLIKDVDVFGYRQNSDAFDICSSSNVTVEGCFARTGDDGYIVKGADGDANTRTENITVKNCYAWMGKARCFGIFGECYKSINNVTFKDCVVLAHDATWDFDRIPAIGIVAEVSNDRNEAVTISNVTFDNILMCRNDGRAINVITFTQIANSISVRDITFRNISYASNNEKILVVNYAPSGTISNVKFENVKCNNVLITDGNKSTYFEDESYNGGYINIVN